MAVRVGTSGWVYPPWRGTFYPPGLPQRLELAHLSRRVSAIEVNSSFYSLQRPTSWAAWAAAVPDDFLFAVGRGSPARGAARRRGAGGDLASGVLALGPKLGPVLWQLPPVLAFDPARVAAFLALLTRTTAAAARVAAGHDDRLNGRAWFTVDADRPLRHALEVRHPSFAVPAFVELLREHDVALVVADSAGTWPVLTDVTASDLVYVRLHGDAELYTSGYTDAALDLWASRVRSWAAGGSPAPEHSVAGPAPVRPRDVVVFFDNDVKVRAPVDAIALSERLVRS